MAKPVKKFKPGDWVMTEQGIPGVVRDVDPEHEHGRLVMVPDLDLARCFTPSQSRLLTPAEIATIKVGGTLGPTRPNKP